MNKSTNINTLKNFKSENFDWKLVQSEMKNKLMTGKSLLQLLGGILFASCMTRPDVAYPVAFLCQFMQNPSPQGYDAALGVLSYMYETRERGLTYGGPGASIPACPVESHHFYAGGIRDMDKYLIGFSDSSFGKTVPIPSAVALS